MNSRIISLFLALALIGCTGPKSQTTVRSAVDTDGNALVDSTLLGDIDMGETTVGDFRDVIAPDYLDVYESALAAVAYEDVTNLVWNAAIATQKYIYDSTTETTYKIITDNDFLLMRAVTNVPPTPDVIMKLERGR